MSINRKRAIITFDYEVFLGRETGTIENCVIEPTKLILKILNQNNAKAIFFVDTTWLLFLKENFYEDFKQVATQLKEIIAQGSSVELHIHPQWLNAYKIGSRIVFPSYEFYKLHSLKKELIFDLFQRSIELLQNITGQDVRCFRAGGWCIEPFALIKSAFKAFNIKYDFSVLPGMFLKEGKEYDFDYTDAPPGLVYYNFHNDVCKPEKGSFIEVPLSTYRNNPVYRIFNKMLLIFKKDKIFGDGIGSKEKSIYKKLNQSLRFSFGMLSLDKTSNFIFRYLLSFHFKKSNFHVIVSHPKTFSFQAMKNLVYISKKYTTLNTRNLNEFMT